MKQELNAEEYEIFRILREKLERSFGVNYDDGNIILKFYKGDALCRVALKIEGITTNEVEKCFMCNENFCDKDLHSAKMTVESKYAQRTQDVKLCYKCLL